MNTTTEIKKPIKKLTTSQRIKQNKPIEIWENPRIGWTWKVWKYNQPKNKTGQYATAFCSVSSPMTYGGCDMGDTYVTDFTSNAISTYREEV